MKCRIYLDAELVAHSTDKLNCTARGTPGLDGRRLGVAKTAAPLHATAAPRTAAPHSSRRAACLTALVF